MSNPFCVAAAALHKKRKRGDKTCPADMDEEGVASQDDVVELFRGVEEGFDHFASDTECDL